MARRRCRGPEPRIITAATISRGSVRRQIFRRGARIRPRCALRPGRLSQAAAAERSLQEAMDMARSLESPPYETIDAIAETPASETEAGKKKGPRPLRSAALRHDLLRGASGVVVTVRAAMSAARNPSNPASRRRNGHHAPRPGPAKCSQADRSEPADQERKRKRSRMTTRISET